MAEKTFEEYMRMPLKEVWKEFNKTPYSNKRKIEFLVALHNLKVGWENG